MLLIAATICLQRLTVETVLIEMPAPSALVNLEPLRSEILVRVNKDLDKFSGFSQREQRSGVLHYLADCRRAGLKGEPFDFAKLDFISCVRRERPGVCRFSEFAPIIRRTDGTVGLLRDLNVQSPPSVELDPSRLPIVERLVALGYYDLGPRYKAGGAAPVSVAPDGKEMLGLLYSPRWLESQEAAASVKYLEQQNLALAKFSTLAVRSQRDSLIRYILACHKAHDANPGEDTVVGECASLDYIAILRGERPRLSPPRAFGFLKRGGRSLLLTGAPREGLSTPRPAAEFTRAMRLVRAGYYDLPSSFLNPVLLRKASRWWPPDTLSVAPKPLPDRDLGLAGARRPRLRRHHLGSQAARVDPLDYVSTTVCDAEFVDDVSTTLIWHGSNYLERRQ